MTPEREQELAQALENYTNPNHPEYDAEFDKKIRSIRPDWFIEEDIAKSKHPVLTEMGLVAEKYGIMDLIDWEIKEPDEDWEQERAECDPNTPEWEKPDGSTEVTIHFFLPLKK